MRVVALAGGVGAGKLLRGLTRAVRPEDVTVIGNVGDDLEHLGLHISPDLDSVMYWLSGTMDRERGWGRAGDTFRAMDELRRLGGPAWFSLGDLDLATHLLRTRLIEKGRTLSEATVALAERFGVAPRLLPVTDDHLRTWIEVADPARGGPRVPREAPPHLPPRGASMPFQEYWVGHRAEPPVEGVRFEGAEEARPAPGVVNAIDGADAILLCPSNPVVSIMPILAVHGIRNAVRRRRDHVVGISPIVGGTVLQGMADRLMPAIGLEVSAAGAAEAYRGLLGAWVIDDRDRDLAPKIEEREGVRLGVTDAIMTDDEAAERLARFALGLLA